MNTIVRGYISGTECARIRILLTVNSLPVGAESFLANCQTPPNHELLIPTRPLYSNVLSHVVVTARIKDSGIPRGRIRNIDPGPRSTERSSSVRTTDPVDSRLTTGNTE